VASYVFYGSWDWRFLGLLLLSTTTDYAVGRRLTSESRLRYRQGLLGISMVVNLGALALFKYFNFFVDSFAELLNAFGLEGGTATLQVILPVGISFYTFQTLAYTIDVYRHKAEAEANFVTFALYVAFFPQLVAGPIERAQRLIPQFRQPRERISYGQFRSGAFLILLGLFKKIAIADALAPHVNNAFGASSDAGWLTLLMGTYAFALQIYGDFSGYTDVARGVSRLFGIELVVNFNQPYLATNITQFWRTWHISLSTWLRDYLYIPLGGNRKGRTRTHRNLMITMLLGGLWHGAAWTFVVWGGLHGLFLAVHRRYRDRTTQVRSPNRSVLSAIGTFHLVCFAWIFFRADSLGQAIEVLTGIATLRPGVLSMNALTLLIFAGVVSFGIDLVQRRSADHTRPLAWSAPRRGVVYAGLLLGIVVFIGGPEIPFIYFQF
jgi:alginate O-acetyltransferase complex protein AlgI